MKRLIFALALLLFTGLSLQAQRGSWREAGNRGDRDPSQQLERLARYLELTDDQRAELREYFTANAEALRGELEEAESQEDRRAIVADYQGLRDEKIRSVLDQDQLRKYEQLQDRRAENRGQRSENRDNGERIERLVDALELTEDQRTELEEYMTTNGEELRTALQNAESQEDRRAIAAEFREQTDEKIRSVLTEEQLAKYERMQSRRGERRGSRGGQ